MINIIYTDNTFQYGNEKELTDGVFEKVSSTLSTYLEGQTFKVLSKGIGASDLFLLLHLFLEKVFQSISPSYPASEEFKLAWDQLWQGKKLEILLLSKEFECITNYLNLEENVSYFHMSKECTIRGIHFQTGWYKQEEISEFLYGNSELVSMTSDHSGRPFVFASAFANCHETFPYQEPQITLPDITNDEQEDDFPNTETFFQYYKSVAIAIMQCYLQTYDPQTVLRWNEGSYKRMTRELFTKYRTEYKNYLNDPAAAYDLGRFFYLKNESNFILKNMLGDLPDCSEYEFFMGIESKTEEPGIWYSPFPDESSNGVPLCVEVMAAAVYAKAMADNTFKTLLLNIDFKKHAVVQLKGDDWGSGPDGQGKNYIGIVHQKVQTALRESKKITPPTFEDLKKHIEAYLEVRVQGGN